MRTILIAVDDSKGSDLAVKTFIDLFPPERPVTALLLYVQKLEGRSFMDDMLGDPELSMLAEMLKGSEYREHLDRRAEGVVSRQRQILEACGLTDIRTMVRVGHPADEILRVAAEEGAEMIIIGSRGRRTHNILVGSVSREVANRAERPVLLAK